MRIELEKMPFEAIQIENAYDSLPNASEYFADEQFKKPKDFEVLAIVKKEKGTMLSCGDFTVWISKKFRSGQSALSKWEKSIQEEKQGVYSAPVLMVRLSRKKNSEYIDSQLGVDTSITVQLTKTEGDDGEEITLNF